MKREGGVIRLLVTVEKICTTIAIRQEIYVIFLGGAETKKT